MAPVSAPAIRTEVQLAAEVVATLIDCGVISKSPEVVARACQAVGVSVAEVRSVYANIESGRYERPRRAATCLPPAVNPIPEPHRNAASGNGAHRTTAATAARVASKTPAPGMRSCSGPCKKTLPVQAFAIKNHNTGARVSECRDCRRLYQQSRYVRVGETKVTIHLVAGDACIGTACPMCGEPMMLGDEITTVDPRHSDCTPSQGVNT